MSDTFPKNLNTNAIPDWQLHRDHPDDQVHGTIEHDWMRDGWSPFVRVNLNPSGDTVYTDSVVTGRGRVSAGATVGNNRREWRLHRNTFYANSEVRSLWWGGSIWDSNISTPQLGHVHRAQEIAPGVWRGWVVTNNIFLSAQNTINMNIWQADGATLLTGSNGASKAFSLERLLRMEFVERLNFGGWLNRYTFQPRHGYGIAAGDLVTIDASDNTFDKTGQPVNSYDPAGGNITMVETVVASPTAIKIDTGSIIVTGARRYWPYWVATRLVGNIMTMKTWRYQDEEPDWGNNDAIKIFDPSVVSPGPGQGGVPTPDIAGVTTGPGYDGLVVAHLRNSSYMEYGATRFSKIT